MGLAKAGKLGSGKGLAITGLALSLVGLLIILILGAAIVALLGIGAAASV